MEHKAKYVHEALCEDGSLYKGECACGYTTYFVLDRNEAINLIDDHRVAESNIGHSIRV